MSDDLLPQVGTRVTFVRPVGRYPHAWIAPGEKGTVRMVERAAEEGAETFIEVAMDAHHEGLAEWDNAIIWSESMENLDAFFQDCTEEEPR